MARQFISAVSLDRLKSGGVQLCTWVHLGGRCVYFGRQSPMTAVQRLDEEYRGRVASPQSKVMKKYYFAELFQRWGLVRDCVLLSSTSRAGSCQCELREAVWMTLFHTARRQPTAHCYSTSIFLLTTLFFLQYTSNALIHRTTPAWPTRSRPWFYLQLLYPPML